MTAYVALEEDRRVRVRVDREDPLGRLAADDVLDRAADAARDVEVRGDARPGLADLLGVRPPAQARRDARHADRGAEQLGQLVEHGERLGAAEPATATDDDLGLRQRDLVRRGRLDRPTTRARRSASAMAALTGTTAAAAAPAVGSGTATAWAATVSRRRRAVEPGLLEQAAGPALAGDPPALPGARRR